MSNRLLRVGLAQMSVNPAEPAENLARAEVFIRKASLAGCRVVVLPECLDIGWSDTRSAALAESIPGPRTAQLMSAARAAGIYVVAGLTERDQDRVHNSAVLIDASGSLRLKHRKINELGFARAIYEPGRELAVCRTEIGCIAVLICADNAPSSTALAHATAQMGADVVLSPSAWAVEASDAGAQTYGGMWLHAYSELAHTSGLATVGVSNVGWIATGDWAGRPCIGASIAMSADGVLAARGAIGPDAEQLIVAEVALRT